LLLASGGDFGEWPEDFEDHDVAEIWGVPPWIAQQAPMHLYERALLRKAIIAEGRAAYQANQQRDD